MRALVVWSDGIEMNYHFFTDSAERDGVEHAHEHMRTEYMTHPGTPDKDNDISYCSRYEAVFQADGEDACIWNVIPLPEPQMDENVKNAILRGFEADLHYQITETQNPLEYATEICSEILALEKLGFRAEADGYRYIFYKMTKRSLDEFVAYELAETIDVTERFLKDTGLSTNGYCLFTLTIKGNVWSEVSSLRPFAVSNQQYQISHKQIQDWMNVNYPGATSISQFFTI